MSRHITRAVAVAILAAVALLLAACGSSSSSSSTAPTTAPATDTAQTTSTEATTTGTAGTPLTVVMSDYAFTPKDATAPAGQITITAPNQGTVVHELVLIKTRLATDKLPLKGTDANEDAFTKAQLPGEISETPPGKTGTLTVSLPAGRYVMLCNVAGHYKRGMVGTLTVQ